MTVVGESVDDRDRAVFRESFDLALSEGADHNSVEEAREHAGGVLNRLAPADLQVV